MSRKMGAEFLGTAAPALFVGGWALAQLWLFWVAPIVGAGLAGAGSG
jgi:glycerol uptake facilitator-like aquaporin